MIHQYVQYEQSVHEQIYAIKENNTVQNEEQ